MRTVFFTFLVFLTCKSYCQEPEITAQLDAKVVIGFPGITTNQLQAIKTRFLEYNEIVSAKYVYGNHNEMLISINTSSNSIGTYYDLLKIIDPVYEQSKTYLNEMQAYDFILNSLTNEVVFQVK